jgi:hypothetical protein
LTPDDFLPIKEASPISKISPPTSSSSKKTSLSKKKKKALMKAFLESLDVGSDEDEDFDASSNASINPQREFFGNSGFDSQEYFPGLEDL